MNGNSTRMPYHLFVPTSPLLQSRVKEMIDVRDILVVYC